VSGSKRLLRADRAAAWGSGWARRNSAARHDLRACRFYTVGQYWHHAAANRGTVFDKAGSGTTLAAASMAIVLGNSSSRLPKLGTDKQGPRAADCQVG
jgi:hypothetical protein